MERSKKHEGPKDHAYLKTLHLIIIIKKMVVGIGGGFLSWDAAILCKPYGGL